jgi:hypothetical protein
MYIRKTRDEYELQIDYGYGYGFETVLTEDRYNEYLANDMFLKQIRIVKKRVKL